MSKYHILDLLLVNVAYRSLKSIFCGLHLSRENVVDSKSWKSMLWTPYLFSKCGHHLLRVNTLDCISRKKMLWIPSLGNQCYGLHIFSISVDSISDE